jgi:hypothetical protein
MNLELSSKIDMVRSLWIEISAKFCNTGQNLWKIGEKNCKSSAKFWVCTRISTKVLSYFLRNQNSNEIVGSFCQNFDVSILMSKSECRLRYRNFHSALDFDIRIPISVSKFYYQDLNFYFSLKIDLKVRELLTVQ